MIYLVLQHSSWIIQYVNIYTLTSCR